MQHTQCDSGLILDNPLSIVSHIFTYQPSTQTSIAHLPIYTPQSNLRHLKLAQTNPPAAFHSTPPPPPPSTWASQKSQRTAARSRIPTSPESTLTAATSSPSIACTAKGTPKLSTPWAPKSSPSRHAASGAIRSGSHRPCRTGVAGERRRRKHRVLCGSARWRVSE